MDAAVARLVLGLAALGFAGVGLWTLVDPQGALAPVRVAATDPAGLVELRAMYGGLELGMAAFVLWTATRPERVPYGLLATALSIGGLGGVRLLFVIASRPDVPLLYLLALVEVLCAVVAGALYLRGRSS